MYDVLYIMYWFIVYYFINEIHIAIIYQEPRVREHKNAKFHVNCRVCWYWLRHFLPVYRQNKMNSQFLCIMPICNANYENNAVMQIMLPWVWWRKWQNVLQILKCALHVAKILKCLLRMKLSYFYVIKCSILNLNFQLFSPGRIWIYYLYKLFYTTFYIGIYVGKILKVVLHTEFVGIKCVRSRQIPVRKMARFGLGLVFNFLIIGSEYLWGFWKNAKSMLFSLSRSYLISIYYLPAKF